MSKTRDLGDFTSAGNPLADGTIDVADINGVTATVDEINILDGLTATTEELNGVAGINTSVQSQLDAKVDLAGDTMTGFLTLHADPTSALHAATKEYVDTIAAAGIHYHTAVRVETPSNLNATYDNGTAGVGATLTNAGTLAAITIDGVALSSADRVLVYNQTNAAHNGIYTVTTVGDGSTAWVLTRATDADSYGASDGDALGEGDAFFVKEGDTGAGELYVMTTSGTITFGTTNIVFTVIAETAVYTAGTGMALDGTTFSIGQAVGTSDSPTFAGITSTSGASVTGNITVTGTVDGRDVATDGTKLDTIETNADVTDATNVAAAGAAMTSNNLNDLANVATARTNLGLGTAATQNVGTSANNVVQLDGTAKLPAVDGSQLTGIEGVPSGIIAIWSGSTASIPTGWVICDGTNSTPDLRDRFIVGAGSTYAVAATGGANTVTLSASEMPSHNHTVTGNTGPSGNHNHNGSTSNTGNHNHGISSFNSGPPYNNFKGGSGVPVSNSIPAGGNFFTANNVISNTGAHAHNMSLAAGGDHTHTLTLSAGNAGSGSAHENRPPYYALAYIMKT